MNLTDLTVSSFLSTTAGSDPVPGGGSVSALCGALAAALGEMVTGLTIGRKKYAESEEEMKSIAPILSEACKFFIESIQKDADAYDEVMKAFKLPKETESEKAMRREAIEAATAHAARVPLSVAKKAVEIMPVLKVISQKGNQNAITDCCVAMMCARTAALGAILNVRINISGLNDRTYADSLSIECDALQHVAKSREEELLNSIKL